MNAAPAELDSTPPSTTVFVCVAKQTN